MRLTLTRQIFCFVAAFAWGSLTSLSVAALTDAQKAEVKFDLKQNTAYEFLATVEAGTQRYRFVTFVPDFDGPDGLVKQRALIGWKGDYLLVRHQCGQLTQWRCTVDQVFTKVGDQLVHLGAIESSACKTLGCSYQAPHFLDIFDAYQINPVTGAQDVPPLPIARRVSGKVFVTDLDATWERNKAAYTKSLACLDQVARTGFTIPCADNLTPWSALVFAAKVARYTARQTEWENLFANHAVSYCKQSADPKCAWRVAGVKEFFGRIEPGAAPAYVPSPVSIVDVTQPEPPAVEKFQTGKAIKLGL